LALPKISVITVSYNCKDDLHHTIQSVVSQSYSNIEYIIIDGGSQDGSVELIKSYKEKISFWVSEKDQGIYWAMNKGMARATGDYLVFINAGDTFHSNRVLSEVFKIPASENIIFGKSITKYRDFTCIRYDDFNFEKRNWYLNKMPNHQAVFISREIYSRHKFNTNLSVFADLEYMTNAFNNYSYKFCDLIISEFELGGISNYYGSYKQLKKVLNDDILFSKGISKSYFAHLIKFMLQNILGKERYLSLYISKIVKK